MSASTSKSKVEDPVEGQEQQEAAPVNKNKRFRKDKRECCIQNSTSQLSSHSAIHPLTLYLSLPLSPA